MKVFDLKMQIQLQENHKKTLHLLLAVLVPTLLVFWWHLRTDFYPIGDAGEFLYDTQDVFINFKTHGIIAALKRIYFLRGLRPIAHPHIASIVMILLNGHVLATISVTLSLFFILFCIYLFKIFNLYLNSLESMIGTWYGATLYVVLYNAKSFRSEMFFIASGVATLYYIFETHRALTKKGLIGLSLSLTLSFLMRPIEALLFLIPIVSHLFYCLVKKQLLEKKELAILLAFTIINIFALILYSLHVKENLTPSQCIRLFSIEGVLLGLLAYYWKAQKYNHILFNFFLIAFGIVFLWYAPMTHQLLYWVNLSNFSEIAINYGGRENIGTFGFFIEILKLFARFNTLFFLDLIILFAILRESNWGPLRKDLSILKNVYVALLLIIFIMTLSVLLTHNGDTRYYHFIVLIFQMMLFLTACRTLKLTSHFKVLLLLLLPIAQITLATKVAYHRANYLPSVFSFLNIFITEPSSKPNNAYYVEPIINLLRDKSSLPKGDFRSPYAKIAVTTINWPQQYSGEVPGLEQWSLNLRARELSLNWGFIQQSFNRTDSFEMQFQNVMRDDYPYFLVGALKSPELQSWIESIQRRGTYAKTEILDLNLDNYNNLVVVLFSKHK